MFAQPGFFIGGPDQRTSKFVSESHPAMIVAGCPVVPLEAGAGCLGRGFSPARVSLSSPAVRYFISVLIVIVVSVIAVPVAGKNPAVSSAARLTAAITKVSAWRAASIIASANASIDSA